MKRADLSPGDYVVVQERGGRRPIGRVAGFKGSAVLLAFRMYGGEYQEAIALNRIIRKLERSA